MLVCNVIKGNDREKVVHKLHQPKIYLDYVPVTGTIAAFFLLIDKPVFCYASAYYNDKLRLLPDAHMAENST